MMESRSNQELQEIFNYLEEVLVDYSRFVTNIGSNGLAANMLLYYRDEIQDCLEELEEHVDVSEQWRKTMILDGVLRKKAREFVKEMGGAFSLRRSREELRPPASRWWWFLDKAI